VIVQQLKRVVWKTKQNGQARFERILKDDTRRCLPALRRSPPTWMS